MLHQFSNPTRYAKNSHIQESLAKESLDALELSGDELIYDIGCGDGKLTIEIAKRVSQGHVVGLDISKQMIDYAVTHHSSNNAEYLCSDVLDFKPARQADVVVSFNTLHWIAQQDKALANIRTVLKEGGKASFIVFPPLEEQKFLYNNIKAVMDSEKWRGAFQNFTDVEQMTVPSADDYSQLMKSQGFEVSHCKPVEKTFQFSSKDIVVNDLCAWLPHAKHLPDNLRKSFVTEVVDKLLTLTGQSKAIENGDVTMKVFPWVIVATACKLTKENNVSDKKTMALN